MLVYQRLRQGVVLVPEGRGIFARLTAFESLQHGADTRRDTHTVTQDLDHVFGLFPRPRRASPPDYLSKLSIESSGDMSTGSPRLR